MKFIIVLTCVIVMTLAKHIPDHHKTKVISQTDERDPITGNYKYSYVLSDGQVKAENRDFHHKHEDHEINNDFTKGVYSWEAPDGSKWTVLYRATEFGGYTAKVIRGPIPSGELERVLS